jgi:hypothetical protein
MDLKLKPASDYARRIDALLSAKQHALEDAASDFINTKVVPELDRMTGDETVALRRYVTVPSPMDAEVTETVISLLTGNGYEVRKSHDGGGMYETLVIAVPEEEEYD